MGKGNGVSEGDHPEIERRRVVDQKFDEIARKFVALEGSMATQAGATKSLQQDVGELKTEMKVNTAVTKDSAAVTTEVRDILTTFKTLGTFAKWISGILAAILGLVAAWKGFAK